jgi:predicted house-cleaning noncanonical NTP pyrophosphatase (MazG superfamily)
VDELLKRGMPAFVRNAGKSVSDRHTDARVLTLKEKLRQQAVRVAGAESRMELLDELAEVLEVVLALGETHGISVEQLEVRRREQRGARARRSQAGWAAPPPTAAEAHVPDWLRGARAPHWLSERRAPRWTSAPRSSHWLGGARASSLSSAAGLARSGAALAVRHAESSRGLRALRRALAANAVRVVPQSRAARGSRSRPPSASLEPGRDPRSRYLPVVIVGTGSSAAVWIVSMTSRALLRYVVRPYLVRYLQNAASGTRVGLRAQGSRTLIRLVLPALAT